MSAVLPVIQALPATCGDCKYGPFGVCDHPGSQGPPLWTADGRPDACPLPRTQPGQPGEVWQPIETAPKGRRVLLWGPGWRTPLVHEANPESYAHPLATNLPTHWMELPATPAALLDAETKGGGK